MMLGKEEEFPHEKGYRADKIHMRCVIRGGQCLGCCRAGYGEEKHGNSGGIYCFSSSSCW